MARCRILDGILDFLGESLPSPRGCSIRSRGVHEEERARELQLGEAQIAGGVSPKLSELQPRDDAGAGLESGAELFIVSLSLSNIQRI